MATRRELSDTSVAAALTDPDAIAETVAGEGLANTVASPGADSGAALEETVARVEALDLLDSSSARGETMGANPALANTAAPSGAEDTIVVASTGAPTRPGLNVPRALTRGSSIGRLKVLRTLGAGGMGVVYAAHDPELDREVAVKLIRGNDSDMARARLQREAQALAKLSHPNVVAVYDVGTHNGQVWISMEFVEGRTLGAWVKQERPRWRKLLAVIKQAARGLAAAHAEGLLHRDIKPDNIMVGSDGRVRVMDFGLARAAEGERDPQRQEASNALSVELTAAGAIMGTPAYMAPEQFLGLTADERTDEFSLAVTLWEALFGQRPFAGDTFPELSVAVTSGKREPAPTNSSVPSWLRRVLERALEVEPAKRFESVRVMLEAIERREQQRRQQATVAGLSLGLLMMAVLGVLAAVQWRAADSAQAELTAEKRVVEQKNAALEEEKLESQRSLSESRGLRAKMLIPEDAEGEALKLGVLAVGTYGPDWTRPPPLEATDALEQVLANDTLIVRPRLTLRGHEDTVWALAYSPDGARIATTSWDQSARVWDARSGELIVTLQGDKDSASALAYSPDGARIATASKDHTARVWDAESGALLLTLRGHESSVVGIAYAPDGDRITTASSDRTARIWDARSGKLIKTLRGHQDSIYALAYAPDGTRFATASKDQTARVWDAQSGKLIKTLEGHEDTVYALAYAPDGARITTASFDKTARVWDARSGEPIATLHGHEGYVTALAYAPDGARIATASTDNTTRVWDAQSGALIAILRGHERSVHALAYAPDGAHIATASADQTARVWDTRSDGLIATRRGHEKSVEALAYAPDNARIATASTDNTARLWDAQTGELLATLRGHENSIDALAYAPDGARVATASYDHTARIWNARSGEPIATLRGHEKLISALAYAPDGTRVATASYDHTARVWDAHSGEPIATLRGHEHYVMALAYSPDGTRIATASWDKTARVWDAQSGELIATLRGHEKSVEALVYSPDGTRIATASDDQTVRVWDATSNTLVTTLRGHRGALLDVTFSSDGSAIATASADFTAKIWNAETGELLADLKDRVGLRQPDGSISWPVPPRELTRIGCQRLKPFERDYPEAAHICEPLLSERERAAD